MLGQVREVEKKRRLRAAVRGLQAELTGGLKAPVPRPLARRVP